MQIFADSLLCSGSLDNISLAMQILTISLSSSGSASQEQLESRTVSTTGKQLFMGFAYSLPYELSVDVLVKAAQEYFNSAAGPADEDIELARCDNGLLL